MNWIFSNVPEQKLMLQLKTDLNKMDYMQRSELRNTITDEIVNDMSDKLVILSGPGTGKTHIFLKKIKFILDKYPNAKILVTTFVRKLAKELSNKIENDPALQLKKKQISSRTLHAIAYDILKNSVTFMGHDQIVSPIFLEEVWLDIMKICESDPKTYSCINFQHQTHDLNYQSECQIDPMWEKMHELYMQMMHLYKALSFDDHIKFAYEEICSNEVECPKYDFIIVDEYQDFNKCEKELINKMIVNSKYTLFAGDDDQVLYDSMKNSHKEYIRDLYNNSDFKKTFLPFCGRCSSNIVNAARSFIEKIRQTEPDSIDKIYLSMATSDNSPKINVVACADPASTVNYIENFINAHSKEIDDIDKKLKNKESVDPFLFVISPNCTEKHIKEYSKLKEIIEGKQHIAPTLVSNAYTCLCDYLHLAKNPENNLIFRKVMEYENFDKPHLVIKEALETENNIENINDETLCKIQENAKLVLDISEKYQLNNIDSLVKEFCELNFISKIITEHKESVDILKKEIKDFKFLPDLLQQEGLNVIELMSFQKCKGLTAEHVFIIGFDEVNMKKVKENAFYVAMTRARKSLHLITTLKIGGASCAHPYLQCLPIDDLNFIKHTKTRGSSNLGSFDKFNSTIEQWVSISQKSKKKNKNVKS